MEHLDNTTNPLGHRAIDRESLADHIQLYSPTLVLVHWQLPLLALIVGLLILYGVIP